MLTASEAATIRAALRYWIDEMLPVDERTAKFYFDAELATPLNRKETQTLSAKFKESSLKFIAAPSQQLLSRLEAESRADRESVLTVIASTPV